ncbi:MBL fold metallo-hydrolase [Leptospira biflexa]|uniref:MBL fold metallo-hydrolase n=1 Tax=Leptospira biflexa TaxID=172 RepID=UPI00108370EA|nr:MBL fold metallo-hydrolase [Leptospira biflexa]TGM37446.1 MBL fold metallo-hydrolase [Leptospira biflexa]TGM40782.1 MBL fold metallo-hydrolase [Leptospira biflexa]
MKSISKMKIFALLTSTFIFGFIFYFLGYPNQSVNLNPSNIDHMIPKPKEKSNLVFSIVKTGEAKTLEAFVIEGGSVSKLVTVAHSAFYIQHPKGNFLFDTGLGTKIKEQFEVFPLYLKILMEYKLIQTAKEQLESNGVDSKSIQDVFFSHLHWDHASGLKDFPNAKIHSVKEELNHPDIALGYIPSQFDGDSVKWNHLTFSNQPYGPYANHLDWFGDGTVVFVPMKGHSEGSVGLFLHTENGEVYFLTGDIVWRKEGFLELKHKPRGARWIVDYDVKKLGEEIVRVHGLMNQNPKLVVIPAHDHDTQNPLGFYPKVIGGKNLVTMQSFGMTSSHNKE